MMTKNEFIADFERRHGRSGSTKVGADLYTYLLPSYTKEDIEKAWDEYVIKEKECEESYLAYTKKKQAYFLKNHRKYGAVRG